MDQTLFPIEWASGKDTATYVAFFKIEERKIFRLETYWSFRMITTKQQPWPELPLVT